MYRFKNVLTLVNDIAARPEDIGYSGTITKLANSSRAYFVHVASTLRIPDEIRELYPELIEPIDEYAEKKLAENLKKNFSGNEETEVIAQVIEGRALDQLLELIARKDIDLVIVKKKSGEHIYEELPEKIARKAPCSVLIIPEDYSAATYSKMLVPLDFAESSEDAMDVALAFAKAASLEKIRPVHFYSVPSGFHKSGKSFDEFAEIMKQNAEKNYKSFLSKFEIGNITLDPGFILKDNAVKGILEVRESEGTDLIVMSTRGRTSGASVILASVTEKIIHESPVPVLAVKKKGTGMSFLKALLEI